MNATVTKIDDVIHVKRPGYPPVALYGYELTDDELSVGDQIKVYSGIGNHLIFVRKL